MKKLRFRPLPIPEWQALDRRSPAPSFFARPAWAVAIGRCFPTLEPHPLVCELDGQVEAVVPLTRVKSRWRWRIYHGMPFDGYTAVLNSSGLLDPSSAGKVIAQLLMEGDEVILNLWPFQAVSVHGENVRIPAETSVLQLGGSASGAQAAIASKSRRMAGQAQRKGATCGIETGRASASAYYQLLREAATARWGRTAPTIGEEFFREVIAQGGEAAEIWIVRYEGEPVSGGVALYGSCEVSLWTTATKPGCESLRPHNLLHASIMEHAGARAIPWYNLNSSSGLEGVLRFKKSLGAEVYPYEIIGSRSLRYRLIRRIRQPARRSPN